MDSMNDVVVQLLQKAGVPVTRKNYLNMAYFGKAAKKIGRGAGSGVAERAAGLEKIPIKPFAQFALFLILVHRPVAYVFRPERSTDV